MVDSAGNFFKPLPADDRAEREIAFYQAMVQYRPAAAALDDSASKKRPSCPPEALPLAALARVVPTYSGVTLGPAGNALLILDDICARYKQPCVLDVKLGHRTWYEWASDAYIAKCKPKDEGTTQASLGFRLCGARVFQQITGEYWAADRQWGKRLAGAADVAEALRRFGDNGALPPGAVLAAALPQLRDLEAALQQQTTFHFFSASLLLTYEGAAAGADEVAVRVRLVDFAHAFEMAEPCRDDNTFSGLQSFIRHAEAVAKGSPPP